MDGWLALLWGSLGLLAILIHSEEGPAVTWCWYLVTVGSFVAVGKIS